MEPARTERRLAAIMFTDIVGYTALMAESEERGLLALGPYWPAFRVVKAEGSQRMC